MKGDIQALRLAVGNHGDTVARDPGKDVVDELNVNLIVGTIDRGIRETNLCFPKKGFRDWSRFPGLQL